MCPNTLRFLRNFPTVCVTQHCLFSAKEAAIALRPFYFAVHPDRFLFFVFKFYFEYFSDLLKNLIFKREMRERCRFVIIVYL